MGRKSVEEREVVKVVGKLKSVEEVFVKSFINLVLIISLVLPHQYLWAQTLAEPESDSLTYNIEVRRLGENRWRGFSTRIVTNQDVEIEFIHLDEVPVDELAAALGRIKNAVQHYNQYTHPDRELDVSIDVPDDIREEVEKIVYEEFPNGEPLPVEEINQAAHLSPAGEQYLEDFGRAAHSAIEGIESLKKEREGVLERNRNRVRQDPYAPTPWRQKVKPTFIRYMVSGSAMAAGLFLSEGGPSLAQSAIVGYGYNGPFSALFNWFDHIYAKVNNSLTKTWQKLAFFNGLEVGFYVGSFILLSMVFGLPPDLTMIHHLADMGIAIPEQYHTLASVALGTGEAAIVGGLTQGPMDFSISHSRAIRMKLTQKIEDPEERLRAIKGVQKFAQYSLLAASATVVGAISLGIPGGELTGQLSHAMLGLIGIFAWSQYFHSRATPVPQTYDHFRTLVAGNPPQGLLQHAQRLFGKANGWVNENVINKCGHALAKASGAIGGKVSNTFQRARSAFQRPLPPSTGN